MYKKALISVYDKTGLEEFLKPLAKQGLDIVSTGGTAQFLRSKNFKVQEVSELTGFAEILSGRVKSLHPYIFAGLLAREWEKQDQDTLKKHNISAFDLVIVNLYPFAEKAKKAQEKQAVQWIDIGGPSLLRAGAKNYFSIMTVCDPKDYPIVQKQNALALRKKMAVKVFKSLALYDLQIAENFYFNENKTEASLPGTPQGDEAKIGSTTLKSPHFDENSPLKAPETKTSVTALKSPQKTPSLKDTKSLSKIPPKNKLVITADFFKKLRYGENPHQTGLWFKTDRPGLHSAKILQGKELSYNNLLDFDNALQALNEFEEPCVVAVKHNNPCGAGLGPRISIALEKALKADPLSVFGALLAFNRAVDQDCAKQLKDIFLEGLIAPSYTPSALEILKSRKNLRLLELSDRERLLAKESYREQSLREQSLREISGGFLIQSIPKSPKNFQEIAGKIVGDSPPKNVQKDLLFAWKLCKHLKSNAIALVKNQQTLGLGMGQVNRVDAVKLALQRFQQFHSCQQKEELVLASDAFFPFVDSILLAHKAGIRWIIQPGGSIRDKEVLEKAKNLNINMILTGKRVFKH